MGAVDRKAFVLSLVTRTDALGVPMAKTQYRLPVAATEPGKVHAPDAVCSRFFSDVMEISSNYTTSNRIERAGRERACPKEEVVRTWLQEQERFHDYMPDAVGAGRIKRTPRSATTGTTQAAGAAAVSTEVTPEVRTGIQLPYPSRTHVYEVFKEDVLAQVVHLHRSDATPPCVCSKDYFRKVWHKHFPHVILRKQMRFAKCDDCVRLREAIGKLEHRSEANRLKYRTEFRKHLTAVKAERALYHAKREQSAQPNSDALSIIFDGADQGAYGEWSRVRSLDRVGGPAL